MPAKGFLTSSQKERLQSALRKSDDPQLRERILMLLLLNDGKTYREISAFLGCAYRSVAYWCVHGEPEKLQVWFWDESGFSMRVLRRKTWSQKGHRRHLTGQRRRGRVNVMGGRAIS